MALDADAIVVGAGLAGLVATAELAAAGGRVIVVEQEPEASLGGQAFWSFGGLFFVGSPEQRRMGIHDNYELALQDWLGSAGFDRPEDEWPRRWAEAYLGFAAGEKRSWLHAKGVRFFPVVGWAERGGYGPTGHGNSVPRFHITWGTGPGVLAPFEQEVRAAVGTGRIRLLFRRRVDELTVTGGTVDGVRGSVSRDGGCRYPGCSVPAPRTDGHHVVHWYDLGRTDLCNLISLCRFHHRRQHEGRFLIEREPSGAFTFTDANGRPLVNVEPQPAVGSLDMSGWTDPERARARDGGAPYSREYAVSALADACVFVRAAGAAARAGPA